MSFASLRLAATITALGLALTACGPGSAQDGLDVDSVGEEIIGGATTTGDSSVVMIYMGKGGSVKSMCSGTLISKRVVATAAHCMDGGWDFFQVYFGSDATGAHDPAFKGWRSGTQFTIHPSWDANNLVNDIALLRLKEDAPVAAKPWQKADLTSGDVGKSLRLVGFGASNGTSKSGTKRKRTVTTKISNVYATKIRYQEGGKNTCNGDSGGPAFMNIGGVEKLVGITSYGDSGCKVYGVNTRIDAYSNWVQSYIDAGKEGGGAPPAPAPAPPPPAGGGSCAHDICEVGSKLSASCDPCVADICAKDPGCCSGSWDSICVLEVDTICHLNDC